MSEDNQQLRCILEGAIFAAGEPLTVRKLQALFEKKEMPEKEQVLEALNEIKDSYEERGVGLIEVASGWRFQVRENVATWVNRLWDEKPQKYSRALIETLALIAYRQPITRGDIEEVRGVAVSSHIIKTLTEREWVKVIGHRDVPGRPALYATTKLFLDYFNLKSLDELPTLGELKDIDSLNQNLEFGDVAAVPVVAEGEDEKEAEGDQETSDQSGEQDRAEVEEQSLDAAESSDESETLDPADDLDEHNDDAVGDDGDSLALAENEDDLSDVVDDEPSIDENDISDVSDGFDEEANAPEEASIDNDLQGHDTENHDLEHNEAENHESESGEDDEVEAIEAESGEVEVHEAEVHETDVHDTDIHERESIVQTSGSSMFDNEDENNSDNQPDLGNDNNDDAVLDNSNDKNRDALDE